jgi:hypothetical protein
MMGSDYCAWCAVLHSQGVPHLAVRVRDGTGLVGPLVMPGVTSGLGNY